MSKISNTLLQFICIIFILSILSSCSKTINCDAAEKKYLKTQDFTEQELSRIIFKRYTKNTNFAQLVDTILLVKNINVSYDIVRDPATNAIEFIEIQPAANTGFAITSGFDYELIFPSVNISRKLTEITEIQQQYEYQVFSVQRRNCINEITSSKLDGVLFFGIPDIKK